MEEPMRTTEQTQKPEPPADCSYLDERVGAVRAKITAAALRAGRTEEPILMAAVKTADPLRINYIHEKLGVNAIGENRVQQLLAHYPLLHREGLHISLIGSLQTNKVKYIVDKVDLIQSLDSGKLAAEIEKQAAKAGRIMDVLVEINSGHEEQKGGIAPEETETFCRTLSAYPHIRLRGFMTMAPRSSDPAAYHGFFRETATLARRIWHEALHREGEPILSMGMSESYEEATEEGSTMVRVGREIFTDPNLCK